MKERVPDTGVLLAYEETGYDATVKGRLPDLLPDWSVRRLAEQGTDVIKILLYYNPVDEVSINTRKHAFIERVGAECAAIDIPYFLEPLVYDDSLGDEKSFEFARAEPKYVTLAMEEFSRPRTVSTYLRRLAPCLCFRHRRLVVSPGSNEDDIGVAPPTNR